MSNLSQYPGPGLFYILSQPKFGEEKIYHDWYNTEHGPLRMPLDFFLNGYRYKSQELDPPIFLAMYDLARTSGLEQPEYTVLRDKRSPHESDVIDHRLSLLNRRVYNHLSTRGNSDGPAPIVMTVAFVVKDELVDEVHNWYEKEHTGDLMRIPGWRRSRRFQLVESDDQRGGYTELLAVHDFEQDNGLDGPEHELAKSRPWRNKILGLVESRDNKRFEYLHTFRASDYQKPPDVNGVKASLKSSGPSDSHIDGPPDGPVVAFSNSLITDHRIWDFAIKELKQKFPKYRYLVYDTRGYSSDTDGDVGVDLLADDLALVLDRYGIDKCFAVVGVSLGGITALNFAIRHPGRLERFVACDCNVASSEANTKAWRARQVLAGQSWEQLANETIQRWFTPASVSAQLPGLSMVRDMILAANKDGFVRCVEALCNFDISNAIRNISVPGICVVGAKDGVLPATMTQISKSIPGCRLVEIPETGHLPMVEDSRAFVQAIAPLLGDGR